MKAFNTDIAKTWKEELRQLKLADIKQKSPGFYELSGGDRMKTKKYCDKTSNGLTTCIIDYLKFNGHYANRINSMGVARKEKIQLAHGRVLEKIRWTPSTTNRGTPDIDSIVKGVAVKIEVKCAATGDRIRDDQRAEGDRITRAGGVYLVISTMEQFATWYKSFIKSL